MASITKVLSKIGLETVAFALFSVSSLKESQYLHQDQNVPLLVIHLSCLSIPFLCHFSSFFPLITLCFFLLLFCLLSTPPLWPGPSPFNELVPTPQQPLPGIVSSSWTFPVFRLLTTYSVWSLMMVS